MCDNATFIYLCSFQGRLFSYHDTHLHRLGTNYLQLPVNCPYKSRVTNYQRDGPQSFDNQGSRQYIFLRRRASSRNVSSPHKKLFAEKKYPKTNFPVHACQRRKNAIKWRYDPRSYERNFCNCVKKPEKFRTSTGFEPVTSRYRCDALTNWAMKPLTLGAGHLWVLMFPWGINQRWNDMKWIIYERRIWNQVKLWSSQLWTSERGHGFKPRRSPEFFRLLYVSAKIAFKTARIIASLDFISAVHIWSISYHFIVKEKCGRFHGYS